MSMRNGDVSHWMHAGDAPAFGPAALEDAYDLVVIGGGLTGLWTAYYAIARDPSARVLVLEAVEVGYGASGRNGGWLSPLLPGNRAVYARKSAQGADGVVAFQHEMFGAIDEVLAVLERERVDADQVRGGQLTLAPTPAAMARVKATREAHLRYGYEPSQVVLLDADETRARVSSATAHGGMFYPDTARVDPAKLTRGLAEVLRRRGVTISEHTPAREVTAHRVRTDRGSVDAGRIAVCLEAYTSQLLGGRQVIPVNSSMIVTDPLPASAWEQIGWDGRECLNDAAHTFIYAQRTADDRIAIGGRGTPYTYGSGTPGLGASDAKTTANLRRRLESMFPGIDFPVAHAWRGVIGVTRDWCANVTHDAASGVGVVYGFAGHGVTATNLAARTLLDRLDGVDSALTRLPWNEHRTRQWEPEPLRWIGVHGMYALFGLADRWEERTQAEKTALLARAGSRIAGLHE
ncbi:FAD-dependent oxidoreductase [Mumia sp. ZJ1417]|nr:FAD-dependent oxidoreductase [Mumia sp. ZJ1417]